MTKKKPERFTDSFSWPLLVLAAIGMAALAVVVFIGRWWPIVLVVLVFVVAGWMAVMRVIG